MTVTKDDVQEKSYGEEGLAPETVVVTAGEDDELETTPANGDRLNSDATAILAGENGRVDTRVKREYSAADGKLRLWLKDAPQPRDGSPVSSEGGTYIAPFDGTDEETTEATTYTASQLGLQAGKTTEIYLEAINPGSARISIQLDPDGDGPAGYVGSDEIRVTMIQLAFVNPEMPTWGIRNDSDDLVCVGNVDRIRDNKPDEAATLVYRILPTDLPVASKKLTIKSGGDMLEEVSGQELHLGDNQKWDWDGKDADGNYRTAEKYTAVLTLNIENVSGEYRSAKHELVDLAVRHKPKVHVHPTEFSPPIKVDYHLNNYNLFNMLTGSYGPSVFSLSHLLEHYNTIFWYADLVDPTDDSGWRDYRRASGAGNSVLNLGAEPAIYLRTYIHNSPAGNQWAFIQYWMSLLSGYKSNNGKGL